MFRKRKNYWIIVDDKFIKSWRKLDLCETKDEAHIWKCEKIITKYRDIVSEKYPENEVLINNDFEINVKELAKEESNLNSDHKEIKKELKNDLSEVPSDDKIQDDTEIVKEKKNTETENPDEVKSFKQYLSDDEELKDDDFNFDIDS